MLWVWALWISYIKRILLKILFTFFVILRYFMKRTSADEKAFVVNGGLKD